MTIDRQRLLQIICGNALLNASALISSRAGASHLAATLGAFAANSGALFHTAQLLATLRAGLTHLSADSTELIAERRTAQNEAGGGLADLGAVQH